MAKTLPREEFDALMRQVKWFLAGVIALLTAPLLIYAFYLDRRLDSVDHSLRYQPPHDVEDYAAHDGAEYSSATSVQGQVVYVPAYSHVYHEDGAPYLLTITLSVRNTSLDRDIVVKSIRYFDTKGNQVKSYLTKPLRLPPLATTEVLVARDDPTGGSGANFLVEWIAEEEVTAPIIEAVMIGTKGQQGISFARTGTPVRAIVPEEATREERQHVSPSRDEAPSK